MADINNILIIYNPISGHFLRHSNDKEIIQKFFSKKNIKYTWLETKPDTSKHIETELKNTKYDRFLVAGGDGTVREVAQFIIKHKIKTPLGIIPSGTSNIFALALGIPYPLPMALKYFYKRKIETFDAGLVNNDKYFLVACGIGYDAKFIKATTRTWKKFFGPLAYVILAVKHSYSKEKTEGILNIDGQEKQTSFSTLVAFNVRSVLARRKNFLFTVHPGVLDILISSEVTVPAVIKLTHKLLRKNKPNYKDLHLVGAKKLSFKSKTPVLFEMDGEHWEGKELNLEIIPSAINIIGKK